MRSHPFSLADRMMAGNVVDLVHQFDCDAVRMRLLLDSKPILHGCIDLLIETADRIIHPGVRRSALAEGAFT